MRRRPGARPVPQITAVLVAAAALLSPGAAFAHGGSPDYRSTVRSIDPPFRGLHIEVLNYDDRLELVNRTGRQVQIRGYEGEPYARLLADGTVEVNKRSTSYYLNEERYGTTDIPPQANNQAPPKWQALDKTGRFGWHDHRIHLMSKDPPRQVTDKDERTKVFDWRVPIVVGDRRTSVRGDLFWVPSDSGLPRGALIGLAAVVLLAILFVEVVRRRRRQSSPDRADREAW